MVEALDSALDAGGADKTHPLASLADYLGKMIEEYEADIIPFDMQSQAGRNKLV